MLLLDNAEDVLWKDEDAVQDLIDAILKFAPHSITFFYFFSLFSSVFPLELSILCVTIKILES
ncbi:MAG: hypothetical protein AYK19_14065 [Theionarchaea archaeon DG-70-1]|nr:MAG: hypothetical protein AYK19_14065 [Theionarchaea archaeon DG-70-1]